MKTDQKSNLIGGLLAAFVAAQPLIQTGKYETWKDYAYLIVSVGIAWLSYLIGKK